MMTYAHLPPVEHHYYVDQPKPHLILNFDINQTLIIGDKVQNKSPLEAIVDALTDRFVDLWDENLPYPMNYNSYVKYYLYPDPNKSKEVKVLQKEAICSFLEYLKETNHRFYPEAKLLFDQAASAFDAQQTLIFPSFYNLLNYLDANKISYTLVFRTFGTDTPLIAEELNSYFNRPFLTDISSYAERNFTNHNDHYNYVLMAGHHLAIQDDWETWFSHGGTSAYGKPFPIDFSDEEYISLFFDDNAYIDPEHPDKNAIAPYDVSNNRLISIEEAIEKKRLFPVDTLQALMDLNYYIDLIDFPLQKFSSSI